MFGLWPYHTLLEPKVNRLPAKGVAKSWVNEVFDMSLVIWEHLFVKLPAVERKDEQFQSTLQSIRTARETS